MALECFERLFHIEVPVPYPIQAACKHGRLPHFSCVFVGTLEKCPCLCIVTSRPQSAKIDEALPLCDSVPRSTCSIQGLLKVSTRLLKVAQRFIRLSTGSVGCR